MEPALEPAGETRPLSWFFRELAAQLQLDGFFPWKTDEALVDAVLDHPSTGHATVASLRQSGGIGTLQISHVANPTLDFDTPSRKIEFYSARAESLGLPALPTFTGSAGSDEMGAPTFPLLLTQGRTLTHFHSFYNNGRELPTLAKREKEPQLWLAPADAAARQLADGAAIRVFNQRGSMAARAHVTERMPPGAVWVRDGWPELNQLTGGNAVLPDLAVEIFAFSAGQSSFDARVEVIAL